MYINYNIDRRISLYDFLGRRCQKAIEFNCKSCYEHISQGWAKSNLLTYRMRKVLCKFVVGFR